MKSFNFRPLLSVFLILILSACGGASEAGLQSRTKAAFALEEADAFMSPSPVPASRNLQSKEVSGSDSSSVNQSNIETERKLIKRGSLKIRVENFEEAEKTVIALVESVSGYLASTNSWQDSMSFSIRVPHASFDSILTGLSGLGKELNRSISTEDVTVRYFDLEGRLESKKQLRETFRGYLKSARNMEEILAVEARLNEVENEIDSVGAQFRRLANLVDFATIDLTLSLPASEKKKEGIGDRFAELFASFNSFLSGLLIFIVGLIIFGIPILAFLALLWLLLFGRIGLLRKLFVFLSIKKKKTS